VLTLVSASRSGAIAVAMLQKNEVAVAPLGVRLAAGLIDLFPIYLAMLLVYHHDGHAKLSQIYTSAFDLWVVGIATILYVVHPMVAELIWGRSLGKMFVGLRVVSSSTGERASMSAVVLRNLMRPIELFLVIPLAVVFFNPLRQRLGDVTAGTLVAGKLPAKGERERVDEE
jgi:uncharacterized RDD family membrane protein YckC